MNKASQLKMLGIEDPSGHRQSARFLSASTLAAGVTILLFTLVNAEADADQLDFCQLTAQAVLKSCRAGSQE
jgi:hypothetical protein